MRRNEQSDHFNSLFLTFFTFLLFSVASHTIPTSGVTRSYTLSYLISGSTQNPYDVKSITDTAAAGHPWATQGRAYTYDRIDRLLTATSTTPGNDTYAYDALDNATTWTLPSGTTSPTYNGLNQIATWGTRSYAYDADGNLLSGDGSRSYKWDAENRLIEIDYVGSSNKSVFAYDGLGHRMLDVETISGTPTTSRYMWCPGRQDMSNIGLSVPYTSATLDTSAMMSDGLSQVTGGMLCQSRDGSDTLLRRDIDEGEYNITSGQKLVYMPDQLGSVRDVLDATTGTLVQSYDYTPYGAVARSSGTTATDYQYAGLFRHATSHLNMAGYRMQDGGTGRWISRDPIREDGGINLYGYVGANPVNSLDPLGLAKCTCVPPATGGIRNANSDEKICTYSCTCSECGGMTQSFTTHVSAGSGSEASCVGQYTVDTGAFSTPHSHSFSFDTNSPSDRIFNLTPNSFMNQINQRCGCSKSGDTR